MKNILILTSFTKRLNLVIVEQNNYVTNRTIEVVPELFDNIVKIHSQHDTIKYLQDDHAVDILLLDGKMYDDSFLFQFVEKIREINPRIKIIIFIKAADKEILYSCLEHNIAACITEEHDVYKIKQSIKISVERILVTVENKFIHEKQLTIDDCFDYLVNHKEAPIKLVNHYKGIPIIKQSFPISHDGDVLKTTIDKLQLSLFYEGLDIVISSSHLGIEILTNVVFVDFEEKVVSLKFKHFLEGYVHNRKSPRVVPAYGSYVVFHNQGIKEKLDIIDISIDHIMVSKKNMKQNINLHEEYNLDINCKIGNNITGITNYIIKTKAFLKEMSNKEMTDKVLFKFDLSKTDKSALESYITYQAKILILELKDKLI